MNNLTDFDQLLDRVSANVTSLKGEIVSLREQLKKSREQLSAKELDRIRAVNEKDHQIEQLERDKMALQKENSALSQKLDQTFDRLKVMLSMDEPQGQQDKK